MDRMRKEIQTVLELRKMNYEDVVEQWKYVTALPTNENGLTNQYEGVSFEEYKDRVLPELIASHSVCPEQRLFPLIQEINF